MKGDLMKMTTNERRLGGWITLLGAMGALLLAALPAHAANPTRVFISASICNWTPANSPGYVQYSNNGLQNTSTTTSVDMWCGIPFSVPVANTAPSPFEAHFVGYDNDPTGGIPPICSMYVKDSSQNVKFTLADTQFTGGSGPFNIKIKQATGSALSTYSYTAKCTIPLKSYLYNISLGTPQ
jgi:hypothetical protein